MINEQILAYIRTQLAAGVSKENITKLLGTSGWSEQDIQQAFVTLTAPAPIPAPVVPIAPVVLAAPTAPVVSVAPAVPGVPVPSIPAVPSPVAAPTSTHATAQTVVIPVHHHTVVMALAAAVAVIVLGGGYVYASGALPLLESYVPFLSHAPYDKTKVLSGVAQGLSNITTSAWDAQLHVFTEPRDANATSFSAATSTPMGSASLLAAFIPANFDVTADLNGATDKSAATTNSRVAVSVSITSEDMTMSMAAEFRKVADSYYGIVTKIPGLLASVSAIKNQWVVITPEDQKKYASIFGLKNLGIAQQQNATEQRSLQDLQTLLSLEERDGVLVSADPKHVVVHNESLYEYDLSLNAQTLPVFYQDAMSALAGEASSTFTFDQKTLTYLQSAEGQRFANYLAQNLTVTLWADGQGIPHQFAISIRVVPDTTMAKLAGKQVRVDTDLTLSNINQTISIDAPTPTISLDAAYKLVTGSSLSEAMAKSRDARRFADLQQIQMGLILYYNSHKVFPPTTAFLAPQYILTLPLDPLDHTTYLYHTNGSSFTVSADLENASNAYKLSKSTISTKSCAGVSNGRFCYSISR